MDLCNQPYSFSSLVCFSLFVRTDNFQTDLSVMIFLQTWLHILCSRLVRDICCVTCRTMQHQAGSAGRPGVRCHPYSHTCWLSRDGRPVVKWCREAWCDGAGRPGVRCHPYSHTCWLSRDGRPVVKWCREAWCDGAGRPGVRCHPYSHTCWWSRDGQWCNGAWRPGVMMQGGLV